MSVALVLVALLPTLAVVLALVGSRPDVASRAARHSARWRLGGLAAGVVVAVLVDRAADLGRGTMLAVPLVALGLLSGVLLGETRRLAPADGARTASLRVRRVVDHLPRRLCAAVATGLLVLVVLLVVGVLLGSADDVGRAGRALAIECDARLSQQRSPWPGSFYAGPLAAVLLGGVLAATLAARAVVRRPLRLAPGDDLNADRPARTRSVAHVVAALGVLVAVPLAGVAATGAGALHGIDCRPAAWTLLLWADLLALGGAVALLVTSLATLVQPAPTADRAVAAAR